MQAVKQEESLRLLKATGAARHEGGARVSRDSWQYRVVREWIEAGATRTPGSGEVAQLTISPPEYAFKKPGQSGQLTVTAKFADGSEENVTPSCDFRIQDDSVAEVAPTGQVTARRAGDTA